MSRNTFECVKGFELTTFLALLEILGPKMLVLNDLMNLFIEYFARVSSCCYDYFKLIKNSTHKCKTKHQKREKCRQERCFEQVPKFLQL